MRVLDTWAWVEYFRGSRAGAAVRAWVEGDEPLATSVFTLAELADYHHREGRGPLVDERIDFISARSRILPFTPDVCLAAGATKWGQRERRVAMGLADAIIYETARAHGLTVVTGDDGFKGLPGVEWIG